MTLSKAIPLQA